MSWLLPSALGVAGVAALVAAALHLIARGRPLAESLPTARFVPARAVEARVRSLAPSDLWLLVLRLAAIAAIGLAVAGPVAGHHGRVVRVIAADRSRAVARPGEVRDSVAAMARTGDVLIRFDSSAAVATGVGTADTTRRGDARGSLSAALAAATRAAVVASVSADSIELVIVSPFSNEEIDQATARLRATWPGRIRLVAVEPAAVASAAPRVEMRAPANDAVAAGLALTGVAARSGDGSIRVVRTALAPADSAWAALPGHALIHWPASDADAAWPRRAEIDAVGAVVSRSGTLVTRLPRLWTLEGPAIAHWADGEPAAVERRVGAGCIRDVGVVFDEASDVTLRSSFHRFAAALLAPCGGVRGIEPVDSAARAHLAGTGPLVPAATLRSGTGQGSSWAPWLLAAGALLLVAELALRRAMVLK